MAVPDHTIDDRLLQSARQEFLKKGFLGASLDSICKNALITTGALYKRYKGKEDLFKEIVNPCLDAIYKVVNDKANVDFSTLTDQMLVNTWNMDEEYMNWWFDFLENWRDEFVLLLVYSKGTSYDTFQSDFVYAMSNGTYNYYKELYNRGLCQQDISYNEMHILLSAFWQTIYEPFIHGYSVEEIKKYIPLVCRLFDWKNTLKMKV